jgi:hypothetical protein
MVTLAAISLFALTFFGQITPQDLPDPAHWMTMGWVVAALFGLVGLANQGLELWRKLFPAQSPPMHLTYATKAEVEAVNDAVNAEMDQLSDRLDETTQRIEKRFAEWLEQMSSQIGGDSKDLNHWKLEIERALGRIEAKVDTAKPRR